MLQQKTKNSTSVEPTVALLASAASLVQITNHLRTESQWRIVCNEPAFGHVCGVVWVKFIDRENPLWVAPFPRLETMNYVRVENSS